MKNRILVAPLNWGLGHATRCIPIIEALRQRGQEVVLASDGDALALLRAEFPDLEALELPSYGIWYGNSSMIWTMGRQLPHILKTMYLERQKLGNIIDIHKINGLISDNRYGLFNKKIPSVFITHQLHLIIPNQWLQKWMRWYNKRLLQKYDYCWIPDQAEAPFLAGSLAHPAHLSNIQYIGALSRLSFLDLPKQYDVSVVLSGPEPQRTWLEEKILAQARGLPHLRFVIVQGKTTKKERHFLAPHLEIYSYLVGAELNEILAASRVVVARSGYSTLMDLQQIRCQYVILIPTPQQTEQEYLAQQLHDAQICLAQTQAALNLPLALQQVLQYQGFANHTVATNVFETALDKFLNLI